MGVVGEEERSLGVGGRGSDRGVCRAMRCESPGDAGCQRIPEGLFKCASVSQL